MKTLSKKKLIPPPLSEIERINFSQRRAKKAKPRPTLYDPSSIDVVSINSSSLEVSWEDAKSEVLYVVSWAEGNYSTGKKRYSLAMKDSTNYIIRGLKPYTIYEIVVFVMFSNGKWERYRRRRVRTLMGNGNTSPSNNRKKDINSGLKGIAYDPSSLCNNNLYSDGELKTYCFVNELEDAGYILASKGENTFSNREIYVRGSGYDNIYPGSIIYVDSDITLGSPKPIGYLKRKPISIYGDFLNSGNVTQNNITPDSASVREATNRIMRSLISSGYEPSSTIERKHAIYTSDKQLMCDLKIDANYSGFGLGVSAKISNGEQTFVQASTLHQDYLTIKLSDSWKQDPSSLFDESLTWDDIKGTIGNKPIAIITSVTYGKTFSYLKEFSSKKFTFDGTQKVLAWGQKVESSQNIAESSSYTKDEIFSLGGSSLARDVLRGKKTMEELDKAMSDNMRFGENNQGVVVKYTMQLITGEYPGKVIKPTYSGKTYTTRYERCPRRVEAKINVADVTIAAGKVKVQMDIAEISINNNDWTTTRIINGSSSEKAQDPWYYTFRNSKTQEYGPTRENTYISPYPLLRIRSKDSELDSYRADDAQRIDVSSGKIEIVLKGSVFAGKNVRIKDVKPI